MHLVSGVAVLMVLWLLPRPCMGEHIVGVDDTVEIEVYAHPELSTVATVGENGEISFPLIGQVKAGGLTTSGIAGEITRLLKDGYFVNPQVTVAVREFRKKQVSVMGKVVKPGLYDFSRSKTFLELLSLAGGLAPEAGDKAVIKRKTNSKVIAGHTLVIDLKKLVERGETFRDVELVDGDSIYVTGAEYFYVTGEVKQPGPYRYEEGITVSRAITLASGYSDGADKDKVTIVRRVAGEEEVVEVGTGGEDLDVPIRKDDTVKVGKAGVFYVTGEVKKPGAYRHEKGTTVIRAISLAGGFTAKAAKRRVEITRKDSGEKQVTERADPDDPVSPGDVITVHERFF